MTQKTITIQWESSAPDTIYATTSEGYTPTAGFVTWKERGGVDRLIPLVLIKDLKAEDTVEGVTPAPTSS